MNKSLKFAAIAAGLAAATGFTTVEANAKSLTVVIDKIELVEDANDYAGTASTVLDAISGLGVATRTTVDLFNATQKLGTTFNIVKPDTGTYDAMLLHFSTVNVVSGTTLGISGTMNAAGLTQTYGGRTVMILGTAGTGAGSVGTIVGTNVIPMQAVTVGAGAITLPTFDFGLPEAAVVKNGSSFELASAPEPVSINTQSVDNADVPNLALVVSPNEAFSYISTTASFTSGSTVLSVGLFDTAVSGTSRFLKPTSRPLAKTTFTAPSTNASQTVTFLDVPSGTAVTPLVWIDADSDGKLDAGEYVTAANLSIDTAAMRISGTADISAVTVEGSAANADIDTAAIAFGQRALSLTIEMAAVDVTTTMVNDSLATTAGVGLALTLDGAGNNHIGTSNTTPAAGSLTVVYATALNEGASRTISFPIGLGADGAGATGVLQTGETAHVALWAADRLDNIANATYSGATTTVSGSVVITGIPLFIDTLAANANTGFYRVDFMASAADATAADDEILATAQDCTAGSEASCTVLTHAGAGTASFQKEDPSGHDLYIRTVADGTAADGEQPISIAVDDE